MKALRLLLAAASLSFAQAAPKAMLPENAAIESIEFEGVADGQRQTVLRRIALREGDIFTIEARHRIGRELGRVSPDLVFSYERGTHWGSVRVKIKSGC